MATKKKSKKVKRKQKPKPKPKQKQKQTQTQKAKAKAKPKSKAKPKAKLKAKPKKKAKGTQPRPLGPPPIEGTLLGRVEDFFAHINVIALTLKSSLRVGNVIHVKGHTTDFTEPVASIQIEHESLGEAKKGDAVGIKIAGVARKRDWVFRVD